jgi:hypothetical protein
MFSKSQSVNLLACGVGGGGGGFSTVNCVKACVFRPRESVQVALTVIGPGDAPLVFRFAVLPLPETLPLLAVQPAMVTGTLSGLLQVQVMVEFPPACKDAGLAEQVMVGGFFGGSFTVKVAMQLASPPFFILGPEIWAVTV